MSLVDRLLDSKSKCKLVIAGAGSGKTYTLTNYLAKLIIEEKINPLKDEIIAFTFTRKAANELNVRLSMILEDKVELLNNVFIGTIDSWCNDYLTNVCRINRPVLGELERTQFIKRIQNELQLNNYYSQKTTHKRVEYFEKDLNIFYSELLSRPDVPPSLFHIINKYIQILSQQRLSDFGTNLHESIKQLSESQSESVRHVFIDEYQDVNEAQVALFSQLITNPQSTLFAVGDPRQAIYQWRGSDYTKLTDFKAYFPDPTIYELDENRRSRKNIVHYSNIIAKDIEFPSGYHTNDMSALTRLDDKESVILSTKNENHETQILGLIKQLASEGTAYSDIAILYRSVINHGGLDLMELLREHNIRFNSPNNNSGCDLIFNFFIPIVDILTLISSPFEPQNSDEEEDYNTEINDLKTKISSYFNLDKDIVYEAILKWHKKLSSKKGKFHRNESYNFRSQFFDFCKDIELTFSLDQGSELEGISAITQLMQAIERIYRRRLLGVSQWRPKPVELLKSNLKWYLENELEKQTELSSETSNNSVTISTVHSAKGLQWPVVILPHAVKGRFPLPNRGYPTKLGDDYRKKFGTYENDERRLWYVAVTRARDRLYILAGKDNDEETTVFLPVESKNIMIEFEKRVESKLSVIEPYTTESYACVGVSELLELMECPYHYYLRRILNINVPIGPEFGIGTVTHSIIQRILEGTSNKDIDDFIEDEMFLPLAEKYEEDIHKKAIVKKVKLFSKTKYPGSIDLEEKAFTLHYSNMLIRGIIDAIQLENGNATLIDWKSSLKSNFLERYRNQIKLYALAINKMGMQAVEGKIIDLTDPEGSDGQIDVDISEKSLGELQRIIETNLKSLSNEIKPTPSETACKICDVAPICKYKCL